MQRYTKWSKRHVVPKEVDPLGVDFTDEESEITFKQSDSLEFFRSRHGELLIGKDCEKCQQCAHLQINTKKLANRAKAKKATPAKLKAPISQTNPARLKVTIQQQTQMCKAESRTS